MTIFGTTHTDSTPSIFTTFRETPSGAVGTRNIGGGEVRVRLQLLNLDKNFVAKLKKALPNWKSPEGTPNTQRFSTVVSTSKSAEAAKAAYAALVQADPYFV